MHVAGKAGVLAALAVIGALGLFGSCKAETASQTPSGAIRLPSEMYRKSYALIIGNEAYVKGWPRLKNAVSDADSVARALGSRGFDVTFKTNLGGDELDKTFKE